MKDLTASVRARLMNKARGSGRPFAEALQYYALERFLYRLSRPPESERLLLKGALMLQVWDAPGSRPTRDIDLLAYLDNDIESFAAIVRDACRANVDDDGMRFDAETVNGERIKEDADYEGVRIRFVGYLSNARVPMQIDVGFGDVVYPEAKMMVYPTLLDFPAPRLRMYPRETLIAEKFEAMVRLGEINSRMKDFFDIWMLSRQFEFSGQQLAKSISNTFVNRGTLVPAAPMALTLAFAQAQRSQNLWGAFIRRSKLDMAPTSFAAVVDELRWFLLPPATALAKQVEFQGHWVPPGPWSSDTKV